MHDAMKDRFTHFCLQAGVLKFGEFKLKSGRKSPYFFNAGLFNTGKQLERLGDFYAWASMDAPITPDVFFGIAYKGVPIATATAQAYSREMKQEVCWAFNRKEIKGHGDAGIIVGASLDGKDVIIPEDVITSGESIDEGIQIVQAQGGNPRAIIIALDRKEVGKNTDRSAVQQVEEKYGIPVIPIITLADLIAYVQKNGGELERYLSAILDYQKKYGV